MNGGYCYSKACKKAEVGAHGHSSGPEKARGLPPHQEELLILSPDGRAVGDISVGDGEEEGSQERAMAALERLMRWIEVTDLELDGEESEKSEVREGKNEHGWKFGI